MTSRSQLGEILSIAGCGILGLASCTDAGDGGDPFPSQRPVFDTPGQTRGYIANQYSDTVSVLDLDTFSELGQVPVGRSGVDIDGPRHISYDPIREQFYVLLTYPLLDNGGPHSEDFGQNQTRSRIQALALDDLRDLGYVSVFPKAVDVALGADGRLFVVHDNDVLSLDTTSPIDVRRSPLAVVVTATGAFDANTQLMELPLCVSASLLTVSADGQHAFVACSGEDSLIVLDLPTATVVARVHSGEGSANRPFAVAESPNGGQLALTNTVSRTLAIFDVGSEPQFVAAISVPSQPMIPLWVNDDEVLVPLQSPGGIARVSVSSRSVVQSISLTDDECFNPRSFHQLPDGRLLGVCESTPYKAGTLVEFDPSALTVLRTLTLGPYPDELLVLAP